MIHSCPQDPTQGLQCTAMEVPYAALKQDITIEYVVNCSIIEVQETETADYRQHNHIYIS
jgi:hypothetical protein